MSLKPKALLGGIRSSRATRGLAFAIRSHVLHLDHPRRAPALLAPLDDAAPNHAQRRHDAHIHDLRRRLKRYLAPLGPFALAIDGNAVVAAERADPRLGPAITAPSWLARAIEEPRDLLVGHQARQLADQRQRILGHRPAMFAHPIHLQIQRGVVPALPMQDHLDEAAFDAHNDLVQCRAQDPLACRCCRSRVRPGELEIGASCNKCRRSFSPKGAGFLASSAAISPSIRCTTCSASFHRRSNSPATKRLAGSTASYCRRACAAEKRACCSAISSCLLAADVSLV